MMGFKNTDGNRITNCIGMYFYFRIKATLDVKEGEAQADNIEDGAASMHINWV